MLIIRGVSKQERNTLVRHYNEVLEDLRGTKKLSEILPTIILIARKIGDEELEKLIDLELNSYFNSNKSLTEDVTVPEYREIPGQYFDIYQRPLIITDPGLNFVNQYRIRNGIAELERFSEKGGLLTIQDLNFINLIKLHLQVEVHSFSFSSTSVLGVLQAIRTVILKRMLEISPKIEQTTNSKGEHTEIHQSMENLHPLIKSVAGQLFMDGYFRQAILDTYILLTETVKTKSGRYDLDGVPLMQTVFSIKNPIIKISDDPDEQLGFMWMFSGAVMGIRNPKAHRLIQQRDPQRTLEWLSYASVLLRALDDAQVVKAI